MYIILLCYSTVYMAVCLLYFPNFLYIIYIANGFGKERKNQTREQHVTEGTPNYRSLLHRKLRQLY